MRYLVTLIMAMAMMGDGEEDRLIDTNTFTFQHNTIYNILCLIFIRPQISQIEILVSLTNCLLANSNCSCSKSSSGRTFDALNREYWWLMPSIMDSGDWNRVDDAILLFLLSKSGYLINAEKWMIWFLSIKYWLGSINLELVNTQPN